MELGVRLITDVSSIIMKMGEIIKPVKYQMRLN